MSLLRSLGNPENPERVGPIARSGCHDVRTTMPEDTGDRRGDEKQVPFFGTWLRIYGAVVLSALVVMALLALFSGWPY